MSLSWPSNSIWEPSNAWRIHCITRADIGNLTCTACEDTADWSIDHWSTIDHHQPLHDLLPSPFFSFSLSNFLHYFIRLSVVSSNDYWCHDTPFKRLLFGSHSLRHLRLCSQMHLHQWSYQLMETPRRWFHTIIATPSPVTHSLTSHPPPSNVM